MNVESDMINYGGYRRFGLVDIGERGLVCNTTNKETRWAVYV
jgi:hypothetical protein